MHVRRSMNGFSLSFLFLLEKITWMKAMHLMMCDDYAEPHLITCDLAQPFETDLPVGHTKSAAHA